MSEKKFNFDIPDENKSKLEKLTNKPVQVDGSNFNYRTPNPYEEDAYEGKVNEEVLKEKRLEYIDNAIITVVKKKKEIIDYRKKKLQNGKLDEKAAKDDLWAVLCDDIQIELEKKGGVFSSANDNNPKYRKEHVSEFSANIIKERFYEWDFLNEDDLLKPKDVKSEK